MGSDTQDHSHHISNKNGFIRVVVKRPFCVASAMGLFAIFTAMLALGKILSEGEDIFSEGNFHDLDHITSQRQHGWDLAFEDYEDRLEQQYLALATENGGNPCEDDTGERRLEILSQRRRLEANHVGIGIIDELSRQRGAKMARDLRALELHVPTISAELQPQKSRALQFRGGDDDEIRCAEERQTVTIDFMMLVHEGKADNVFTPEGLHDLKEVELKVPSNPDFSNFCKRKTAGQMESEGLDPDSCENAVCCADVFSPIRPFYAEVDTLDMEEALSIMSDPQKRADLDALNAGNYEELEDAESTIANQEAVFKIIDAMFFGPFDFAGILDQPMLADEDVERKLTFLAYCGETVAFRGWMDFFFDKDFSPDNLRSKYTRSFLEFGFPLEGFKNSEEDSEEQNDLFKDWFQDNFRDFLQNDLDSAYFTTYYLILVLAFDEILAILMQDLLLMLVSLFMIFSFISIGSKSTFLAMVGILEIIFSIPCAWFVYFEILGFKTLSVLAPIVVFVIMAIGADDIFVFVDAYHQSKEQGKSVVETLETRMSWTYNRAASAMLITSATTMAAFCATAISPLIEIQSFGIMAALVIMMDYIFVITWFTACVVIYHNHFESRNCLTACGVENPNPCAKRCVGDCCNCCLGCCASPIRDRKFTTDLAREEEANAPANTVESDAELHETFFSGPFADAVIKFKFVIFVFFGILVIPMGIKASQASSSTKESQNLPDDHPFQLIPKILEEEFPSTTEDPYSIVSLVWGISGVDRGGVDLLKDNSFFGEHKHNSRFQFDVAAQQHLHKVCKEGREDTLTENFLSKDPDNPHESNIDCFILDFEKWLTLNDEVFPVGEQTLSADEQSKIASAKLQEFLLAEANPLPDDARGDLNSTEEVYFETDQYHEDLIFDVNGELVAARFGLYASFLEHRFLALAKAEQEYNLFENYVKNVVNEGAPPSADDAYHTSEKWVFMRAQELFELGAYQGCQFGLLLAFVVLLFACKNIILAVLASITIAGILVCVFGFTVIIGWELGVIESVCLTVLAGFSVDYVVHLSHAYIHCPDDWSADARVKEALKTMGFSVLNGMLTSAAGAIPLMLCLLYDFKKFGTFLFLTVTLSYLWATTFFLATLAIVRPTLNHPKVLMAIIKGENKIGNAASD